MFFEILLSIFAGIFFGIITGLTPGIHINLISLLLLSISPFLLSYVSLLSIAVFIIAMSITHTFLDSIPSIFLGAPEASTALGVLPGHRYLLRGNGLMALKLTIIGSFGALLLSILLFPILLPIVKFVYPAIKDYIGYILLFVVVFMILRDKFKLWALFIFLISGVFGFIVFNLNLKNPLFPMLSGLFGISTLLISLFQNQKIPKQKITSDIKLSRSKTVKALFSGQFSGFLTSIFPGLGSAQAAVISMQITPNLGDHGFMILIGSINTANFTTSLATLYMLNKARNGSVVVISKLIESINLNHILLFLFSALIAGSVSVFLALKIGRVFADLIDKINYRKLVISIVLFISLLTFILTGPLGFFVLITSTFIGIIPAIVKTTRTHSMGCLLLPVMIYFIL
ncbi:tripartite tricarboxylate transporter permease [Candidatus Woesearchaeota archaeon]|jgi:putative membrane protein|nr:tripartite tricarboxylate transporter permease [Candidatus Woesearchaeota archaeon]